MRNEMSLERTGMEDKYLHKHLIGKSKYTQGIFLTTFSMAKEN